jgi:negative regulator of flagellin synthesis FlgM
MSIEITGHNPAANTLSDSGNTGQVQRDQPTVAQQETGKPSTLDTVSVTDAAKQLQQLESNLADTPVVDIQRVEQIRQDLTKGTLKIDAGRVAEKFFQFEFALQA